eukprot:6440129-Alexandrium_andersonii.AAC.1
MARRPRRQRGGHLVEPPLAGVARNPQRGRQASCYRRPAGTRTAVLVAGDTLGRLRRGQVGCRAAGRPRSLFHRGRGRPEAARRGCNRAANGLGVHPGGRP